MTFATAALAALGDEMARDERVWVLGEDVRFGGVFGQYKGLVERFGPARIVDTPIAELTIMGAGLGAALVGTRPVIEMRIADFVLPAMDELVNQVAKIRYMTGGQARVPLVVRMPHGILPGSAAQHNQTIENWFVNVPGLVVLVPATAADVAASLKAAIRSDDPVIIFEPKALFRDSETVPDVIEPLAIGKAMIRRAGRDMTVVTWSQALPRVLEAATLAQERGIEVEVIDLRCLWPWDDQCVAQSLKRTGRLVVVQEGGVDGGFGNDVVATMIEQLGPAVIRSVERVGAPRMPHPFAPTLEAVSRLSVGQVLAAMQRSCAR